MGPLSALVLGGLSCAVLPVAPAPEASAPATSRFAAAPEAPATPPVAAAPVAATSTSDPVVDAVHEHLLRWSHRSGLTEAERRRLAETVVEEARRHDFDPALVLAVMHVESLYDTYAVSHKDALGLMQILPSTGEWIAGLRGIPWRGPETLFDPVANVRIGVAYLRQLTDRYGSIRTALVAYNWGPGRIDRRLRSGIPLPREYAQLVLTAYGEGGRSS